MNKIIWLLWLQGWDSVPTVVRFAEKSWSIHNPEWTIVRLDSSNLAAYMDTHILTTHKPSPQASSDIVRLQVLAAYGGVWADATLVCMRPLDGWIDSALKPCGFWMYHGRDKGRGPCSWFMVSRPGSVTITKWNDACIAFWNNTINVRTVKRRTNIRTTSRYSRTPTCGPEYFWMDRLFANLATTDLEFRNEWSKVPFLDCNAFAQSHCMMGKVFDKYVEERDSILFDKLKTCPPFVVKLDWRGEIASDTMAWKIYDIALKPCDDRISRVGFAESPDLENADFFTTD